MDISRKTEVYKLIIESRNLSETENRFEELTGYDNILDNVLNYYYNNFVYNQNNNQKFTIKSSNICFYIKSVEKKNDIRKVKMNYIKFNKNTQVVDIESLEPTYKKEKNEGDEEYQHYVIKTYSDINRAVLVFEKISGAITIGMLKANINKAYKEWVRNTYDSDENKEERNKLLGYTINIKIVPSPDFIEELEKMDKISLLKVTVDKEKITSDEDLIFSEENISRDDVDIIYRPFPTLSFSKYKVKKYYEYFKENSHNTKIKRIVINGRKDGNGISLDTEQMKLSKYIKTQVDLDGFVDSKKIFDKYEELINKDFKEYFNNMFIDIDEDESEE